MKKAELFEKVNNQIIQLMKDNGQDWAKGWASKYVHDTPRNVISNKGYSGFNSFITYCAPFSSPLWGTYKQWKDKGVQVNKGEKATHIIYASKFLPKDQKNLPKDEQKSAFCLKPYAIFNSEQTDYVMPACEIVEVEKSADVHADAEVFVSNTGANITHEDHIGIDAEPRADHAKYINNWIKAIRNNESAMLTAFSHATKAVEYLDSLQQRKAIAA
jgi:antirestriction protein ArdC